MTAITSIETKTITSHHIGLNPIYTKGHDFCELIVDEQKNQFTARLYGNEVYTFGWSAPGDDFIAFLIHTFENQTDYLFGKLEDCGMQEMVDTEKSAKNMQKKLLEARYKRQIDEEEARDVWEEILAFKGEDGVSQIHLYDVWMRCFEVAIANEILSDEPWYEEVVVYKEDWRCRVFCEKVAPLLAEVLRQHHGKPKKNNDTHLAI